MKKIVITMLVVVMTVACYAQQNSIEKSLERAKRPKRMFSSHESVNRIFEHFAATQNPDGSFTLEENSSQPLGSINLFCGNCEEDLSPFHQRFQEMIF